MRQLTSQQKNKWRARFRRVPVNLEIVISAHREISTRAINLSASGVLVDLRGMQLSVDVTSLTSFNEFILQSFSQPRSTSIAVVVDNDLDGEVCAGVFRITCAIQGCERFEVDALQVLLDTGAVTREQVEQAAKAAFDAFEEGE